MRISRTASAIGILLASLSFHASADNLLDVYWVAEKQDPVLRSAEANRQAARERHNQSVSQLLPQIEGTLDAKSQRQEIGDTSHTTGSNGYGLSLTQSIYHHDRYQQLKQTRARIQQADLEFGSNQRNLMSRVAEGYFNVLAAADNLEFARSEKEAVGRQLEQTKQRFEVGLIAITDVHESQAAFDQTVAQEITAQNDLSNSREALRELTGQFHDSLRTLTDFTPALPEPDDVKLWVDTALKNNQLVLAAESNLEAARIEVIKQQSGHYPFVDLIGQHQYTSDAGSNFGDESLTSSSIMLQLTVPILSGGATSARVRESEFLYDQALENLEKQRRSSQRSVSAAFLNVEATISRIKALKQAVVSTQSALKASEAGLEVGTRTTVDVLTTRRDLFRAERDHARARYDYVLQSVKLKEAAGTLSMPDFEKTNELLK